jgi:DNA-binding YbaB/EbfC family protein
VSNKPKPKKPKSAMKGGPGAIPGFSGGMPDIQQMMQQVQKMQQDMADAQASLADETVEATAGGGMVTVVATGAQEIVSIRIDPEAVDPDDVEMLQDIIVAGVNEALRLSREVADSKMSGLTGGLDLGSFGGLLG